MGLRQERGRRRPGSRLLPNRPRPRPTRATTRPPRAFRGRSVPTVPLVTRTRALGRIGMQSQAVPVDARFPVSDPPARPSRVVVATLPDGPVTFRMWFRMRDVAGQVEQGAYLHPGEGCRGGGWAVHVEVDTFSKPRIAAKPGPSAQPTRQQLGCKRPQPSGYRWSRFAISTRSISRPNSPASRANCR